MYVSLYDLYSSILAISNSFSSNYMDGLFKGGINMYVQKYLKCSVGYLEWLLFSVPQELTVEEIEAIILVLNVKKGGYLS